MPSEISGEEQRLHYKRANYEHLGDVEVDIAVELGRKKIPLNEAVQLRVRDIIKLDKLAGEAFALRANGHAFAEGEIVVISDVMGCRITRVGQTARR